MTAAVRRFTIGYDKLCKSCPTRLQPRIDTLEEMILGLPAHDREALLSKVARRIQEGRLSDIHSDQGVYHYQTTGVAKEPPDPIPSSRGTEEDGNDNSSQHQATSTKRRKEPNSSKDKVLGEMEKSKRKFDTNKAKLVQTQRLLSVTTALLAAGGGRDSPPKMVLEISPLDNAIYHRMDELRSMSRAELKMERLKLAAQTAKLQGKISKQRLKLYGASLTLAQQYQ